MLRTKPRDKFILKCTTDLIWAWTVCFILLEAVSLAYLFSGTGFSKASHTFSDTANIWLHILSSFYGLAQVFDVFCVIMGCSGLGEELSARTARLWLLRPRSRTYFVVRFQVIGLLAVSLLGIVLFQFLAGAKYFLGPPTSIRWIYRSPYILAGGAILIGNALFAISRLLTLLLRNSRLALAVMLTLIFVSRESSIRFPRHLAPLIPSLGSLVESSYVFRGYPIPYPVSQVFAWLAVFVLCYVLEIIVFRKIDIRV